MSNDHPTFEQRHALLEQQMLADIALIAKGVTDLALIACEGRHEDARMYCRQLARKLQGSYPGFARQLREIAGPGNILRADRPVMGDFTITSRIPEFPEHTHGLRGRRVFMGKQSECLYCTGSLGLDLSAVKEMSECDQDHTSLSYHFTNCPACGLPLQDEEAL